MSCEIARRLPRPLPPPYTLIRMWVLCAPSGFKGRMTATEAASRFAHAAAHALGVDTSTSVDACPLADGGAGTLAALCAPLGLSLHAIDATRLDGVSCSASIGLSSDLARRPRAVIESASVVGLTLVPAEQRTPRTFTSRGVGELVREAVARGAREVWIGLGDTGVVDGGHGMMEALAGTALDDVTLVGLVDVDAPLVGTAGARRFMEQKGVSADELDDVERELAALHPRFLHAPGAGAAGGLGAAILALGGTLRSGARAIADAMDLDARVARAALVLTGEGALDAQTLQGKALGHLASLCSMHHVPLVALCGRVDLDGDALRTAGIVFARALGPDARVTLQDAVRDAIATHLPRGT
jgi:glycerate 2-kinase